MKQKNKIKDNSSIKKPTVIPPKPAEPTANPATPKADELIHIVPFDDGCYLKFIPNPRKAGTYICHDKAGTPFLLAAHATIAEMVCSAVSIFFHTQTQRQRELEQRKEAAAITDNIMPGDSKVTVPATGGQTFPAAPENIVKLPTP